MINYRKIFGNILLKLLQNRKSNQQLDEEFFYFKNDNSIWTEEMAQHLRRAYEEDQNNQDYSSLNNNYHW